MNDRLPYDSFVIAPEAALPYSKGVMAKMLMVTGIPPTRAYSLAQEIEGRLVAGRTTVATGEGLFDLAADVLRRHEGESAMLRLRRYKALHDLDLPVIVLVGGSTGAGKSAVATEVRSPSSKLKPPWESVWVTVCFWPRHMVWMLADSVI